MKRSWMVVSLAFAMGCGFTTSPSDGSTDDVASGDASDVTAADAPDAAPLTTHDFCNGVYGALLNDVCGYWNRCCTASERSMGLFGLLYGITCSSVTVDRCSSSIDAAVASGHATFDPAAAQRCVTAFTAQMPHSNATCGGPDSYAGQSNMPQQIPDCTAVVHGTIADGLSCVSDVECTGGTCAGIQRDTAGNVTTPGHCFTRGASGATCAQDDECRDGYSCFAGHCALRAGVGTPCDSNKDCWDGNYCPTAVGDGGARSCLAKVTNGHTCATADECLSGVCTSNSCAMFCGSM